MLSLFAVMEPNPKCPQCHGTGIIELFTSVIACECLFFQTASAYLMRPPKANVSVDDAWWDAFNDHGNGD